MLRRPLALFVCLTAGSIPAAAAPDFETAVKPYLARNCFACHNAKARTADLDLAALAAAADSFSADPDTWEKVVHKIRTGEMPPKGFPKPKAEESGAATAWVEAELARREKQMPVNPGRVTARRLNRAEYNNTMRDLLGVDLRPADEFPQDDSGYGFDNIGDVLSLSPVLLEKYLTAAERSVRAALRGPEAGKPRLVRYQPPYREFPLSPTPRTDYDETGISMPNAMHVMHRFPVTGEYVIRLVPEGRRPTASMPFRMGAWIDGKLVETLEVDPPHDGASQDVFGQAREFRIRVTAGEHWIAGTVLKLFEGLPKSYGGPNPSTLAEPPPRQFPIPKDLTGEKLEAFKKRLEERRRLFQVPANRVYIHYIEITGPYNAENGPAPASRRLLFPCGHDARHHTAACERRAVTEFARRAFRRPVNAAELAPFLKLSAEARRQGAGVEEAIGTAFQAILVSPDFLFRIETAREPAAAGTRRIGAYELASRISYMLWSSMPDEELLRAAGSGALRQRAGLEAQVRRMLRDPKARALVENFGGQWLETRRLESVAPDREKFPSFDEYLRMSMRQETDLFFGHIVAEDRSILEFLDAPYTYLNQKLAEHYGIPGVKGHEFRRVDLTGTPRGGVLTQASVLTVSSYATRTSPVLRGKWILENLLNAPPPPPPPNVPALEENQAAATASLRQQMEQHRSNAVCASCHARMDPLGFGMENFNAIGAWRTEDGKFPIDPAGKLPDGRAFNGPADLRKLLLGDRDDFARGLTEKMLTYALGRGLERYDRRTVREIAQRVAEQDYRFSSLVLAIIESLPFQARKES